MTYSPEDRRKALSFYDNLIAEEGLHNPRALSWISASNQQVRFAILSGIGNLNNRSILDVGCGFGDLYDFLVENNEAVSYKGIDINKTIIDAARNKHPGVSFDVLDFGEYTGQPCDYVLASGALTIKIPQYKEFYFGYIKKMFELSQVGTAFNMLNAKHYPNDDELCTYSVPEVYEFCTSLTDRLVIRQDYLPQDFTFYLYR